MLRRVMFVAKEKGLLADKRWIYNELIILFWALITLTVISMLYDLVLPGKKGGASHLSQDNMPRVRTKGRSEVKSGEYEPYTGHPLYVTDDIVELILNADACPGSPPIPIAPAPRIENASHVLGNRPQSFTNLIHHQESLKGVDGNSKARESNHGGASDHNYRYDALFIVCSNVKKPKNRQYFREIYGNFSNTQPFRIKVVFLVGKPTSPEGVANITREASLFSDIVMGNYIDHYDNLTYKTITGYRWIHSHCRNVDLVLKLDDDVFVDVFKFFDVFPTRVKRQGKRTINCFLNKAPIVHRVGKYRVSEKEFEGKTYPPFCSGFFIVPTPDLIDIYVSLYKDIRFFRLEDVFSYGLIRLASVDVQLIHTDLITVETREYMNCVLRYKYRCKYLAGQVKSSQLLHLRDMMAEYRKATDLKGNQTSYQE